MPLLWRYLFRSFFPVFLICISSFVSVALVSRAQDIARFASSGAPLSATFLFALYQIPYILPFSVPLACLISTILLFQRLSHTHELTALRACGISLKTIAYPLLISSTCLSLLNFTITSEIGPYCRILSKELIYKVAASNPLVLLQKGSLIKIKDAFIDIKVLRQGHVAEDVVVVINNSTHGKLSILTAKELFLHKDQLQGKNVTLISSIASEQKDSFDHLVVENQADMSTKASNLSRFLVTNDFQSNYDYLSLRKLLVKYQMEKNRERKRVHLSQNRPQMELARRITLGLAPFTFSLIGIAFGMEISRNRSKRGIMWALSLTSLFFICYVGAKSWRFNAYIPLLIYFFPHFPMTVFSLKGLKRVSRGIE